RSGADRPLNSGNPSPSATGSSTRRYSSTRPSRVSDCAKDAPPYAIKGPADPRLSFAISSARSPRAIRVSGHVARSSDVEKTTFGIVFIGSAYASSDVGQNPAISSYVLRPIRCASASRIHPSLRSLSAGSSGGVPQPPAPNRPGRGDEPVEADT